MTRIVWTSLVAILLWVSSITGAWADAIPETPPLTSGASLFEFHCSGCHINGGNIIRRGKTLKQKALERNGYDSLEAIAQLVTQGKGNMPAYAERMTPEEIQAIAAYVLEQAAQNWKS